MDAQRWQRVGEIFDRVVDLPESERYAALDELQAKHGGDSA